MVERLRVVLDCSEGGPSLARQEFRDECDINFLMERFARTGVLVDPSMVGKRVAAFGDFTDAQDFTECNLRLVAAVEAFESLPGKVRERFNHDPADVLAFLSDEANRDEAILLGLVEKPVVEPVVAPVDPAPAPSKE